MLTKLVSFLDGKKSFLSAALLVVLSGLLAQGYIDQKTYEVLVTILGALGLTAIRLAIKKLE